MAEATREKDIQEGKFFAVISYISFLCIVTLLLKKDNKFALFHAKQGLVLFVFEVIFFVLSVIPVYWLVGKLVFAAFVLISFLGILQALKGTYKALPLVSDIAEKIVL